MNQYILHGMYHDCDNDYNIMTNFGDDGYDFYIASRHDREDAYEDMVDDLKEEAKRFEIIRIPETLYLVCETERAKWPNLHTDALRKKAVSEWLPTSGYELADAPEIELVHWFYKRGDEKLNNSRYIELWLPIKKVK